MGLLESIWKELISLEIFLPFIPLLVAFDALGILPIFVSLTSEMEPSERRRVIRQSTLTAFLVSIGFLAAGRWVSNLLGSPSLILGSPEEFSSSLSQLSI